MKIACRQVKETTPYSFHMKVIIRVHCAATMLKKIDVYVRNMEKNVDLFM